MAAARLPRSFAPMLAKPGTPFDSDRHLYEVKWDGIRAVALVEDGRYRLLSRAGNDLTRNYPELAPLARLLPAPSSTARSWCSTRAAPTSSTCCGATAAAPALPRPVPPRRATWCST